MTRAGVVMAEVESGPETPDVESSTARYARRFAGPAGEYLLDVQTRILLELLAPWPGARVLDIGGGHAQAAAPLIAAGYRVTVLGSCDSALERVRQRVPAAQTALGDLCEPPFDDASFDVAVALRMMPHVRDWRRLVAGLCRVARYAAIVDFPTPASANALAPLLFGAKKKYEGDTRSFAMMARAQVRREFARRGFADVVERPQFFWPMVLHRSLNKATLSKGLEWAARRALLTRLLGSPVIVRGSREEYTGA